MIDGLIQGRLHGAPTERASKTGKVFVTARLRAPVHGGESEFVSLLCFREDVQAAMKALDAGDAACVAGEVQLRGWKDRSGAERTGIEVIVHAVLTPYHVTRKREAAQGHPEAARPEVRGKSGRPLDEAWRAGAPGDEMAF